MEIKVEVLRRQNRERWNNICNNRCYAVLGLITSGSCTIDLNYAECSLVMHDSVIINSSAQSHLITCSDDFECYILYINKTLFEEIIFNDVPQLMSISDAMQKNKVLHLKDEDYSFFLKSYQYIDYCIKQNGQKFYNDIIRHQFTSIFLWLLSIIPSDDLLLNIERNRQNDIAEKFLKSLKSNFHNEHKVEFYADNQFITPKYLSTVVKSATGETVHGWINKYIILEAKAQLKSTGKTIQQIANELNFPNQSFFSKFFKKSTNLTPSEYRKLCPCGVA